MPIFVGASPFKEFNVIQGETWHPTCMNFSNIGLDGLSLFTICSHCIFHWYLGYQVVDNLHNWYINFLYTRMGCRDFMQQFSMRTQGILVIGVINILFINWLGRKTIFTNVVVENWGRYSIGDLARVPWFYLGIQYGLRSCFGAAVDRRIRGLLYNCFQNIRVFC